MRLTGLPFVLLVAAGAAGVAGVTALLWNRWPGRWAVPMRALSLLAVLAAGGLLTAAEANRVYSFYATFGELFGGAPAGRSGEGLEERGLPPGVEAAGRRAAARGQGLVIGWRFAPGSTGPARRDGLVYLPAAYFDRSRPQVRFPVLELFHGAPGGPPNWIKQVGVDRLLDAEIAAGRLPPVIAVMPRYSTKSGQSCVDTPGGLQDAAYLARQVPVDVIRRLRALATPGSWATLGFSTGGFCSVTVALHEPLRFGAAAAMSGYFTAVPVHVPNATPARRRAVQEVNSPDWLISRGRGRHVALYLLASAGDPSSVRDAERMRRIAGPHADLTTVVLPSGGHNFRVWSAATPPALDWLAARLPAPLAPPLLDPGARVEGPPATHRLPPGRTLPPHGRPATSGHRWTPAA